jgi:DNA-binding CsgD family transcriptional regulator
MEKDVLAQLVEDGLSVRAIATRLNASPSKVRYWLTKWRLKTRAAADRSAAAEARQRGNKRTIRTCRHHGATEFVLEGRGYFRCAKCRQARVAAWRRRVKARLVAEAGGACTLCGYDRYTGALHFHHRDPTQKEFGLAFAGVARSVERLRAEAGKCVLLCSNCHAEVEGGVASLL